LIRPTKSVLVSHPFRKERGKDGAPKVLLTLESKTLELAQNPAEPLYRKKPTP